MKNLDFTKLKLSSSSTEEQVSASASPKKSPPRDIIRVKKASPRISPRLRTTSAPDINSTVEVTSKKEESPRRRSCSVVGKHPDRRMSRKRSNSFKLLFDHQTENVENEASIKSPSSKVKGKPSPLSPRDKTTDKVKTPRP